MLKLLKMLLDVYIEPTFRFAYTRYYISYNLLAQTDRQKVTHKSPPCNLHRWAQKSDPPPWHLWFLVILASCICTILKGPAQRFNIATRRKIFLRTCDFYTADL